MATLFSSVVCVLVLFQLVAGDGCQTTNDPCKATCGKKDVDLSQVLPYPVTIPDNTNEGRGKYNYSINLCKGVPECHSADGVTAAICQFSASRSFNIGSTNSFNWSLVSTSPFKVTVIVGNGKTQGEGTIRQSQITIKENSHIKSTQISYDREDQNTNTYYFNLQIKTSGNIVGPIGLTLILLAIVGLVIYFIVGSIFMYFVKGARGVEIIPNLAFWTALPFLVKDGCLFTISPCYKRGSYEKI